MKILLINDDGISSPGLWAAVRPLRRVGEVFVMAPAQEQSGVGASLTLHAPVRVGPWEPAPEFQEAGEGLFPVTAYSAEGTPGDCCILALESVTGPVDLVVSGINSGTNTGWDVMVSGTVGGAVQGFIRGCSTIAISVGSVTNPRYETAGRILESLAGQVRDNPSAPMFLNVNIPNVAQPQIAGIKITRLGNRSYGESVRQEEPSGNGTGQEGKLYRIARNRPIPGQPEADTDIWAVRNNWVSVTPLKLGMGDDASLARVSGLLAGLRDALLAQ